MKKTSMFILACGMAAGLYTPASAQLNIDCGNPQNALTHYCNNRDQYRAGAPMSQPAPAFPIGGAPSVSTTGSVVVAPSAPMMSGGMMAGPMTTGSVVVAPSAPMRALNIDCGNPQNALTHYCNNRNQYQ